MLGGLYRDFPLPYSTEKEKPGNNTVWLSSTKMASQMILKAHNKPKSSNAVQPKITASTTVALSPTVIYSDIDRETR
ncbi:hypothetical protein EV2_048399 [Malus domestica]